MIAPRRTLAALYGLWRHPHVAREDIVAFQNKQLRRLVSHAYENVPHYRTLFDGFGLRPPDIESVADLPAIPITSRRDLLQRPVADIVARGVDPQRLITRMTSGSSGEPFSIRRTWLETRLLQMFRLRAMHDLGLRLTDKVANVLLVRPLHAHEPFPLGLLRSVGLYRRERLNCLSRAPEILRELRRFSPNVLGGLAGALSHLAHVAGDADRRLIRPRFIVVGGEVLTPLMRHQIARAFAAPVLELYTCHEGMTLAWECRETGELHTSDDSVIVEVLKDGRPAREGERGEVIVTNLHAFAMPFLRYRLGDIVTKGAEACRCGKPYATIRAVQGRMIDYFPLPNGRVIHPYQIVSAILQEAAPWLRAYQMLQEREDRIVLYVVPSATPTHPELRRLHTAVIAVLGPDVEFQVRSVPEIQLEETGKFRVSRSLVRSAYDGIDWTS